MPVSRTPPAPILSARTRPIVTALWLSLGLHGAVIALVQPAPPASSSASLVIEARLETREPETSSVPAVVPVMEAEQPETPEAKAIPVLEPEFEPVPESEPISEPEPITVEAELVDLEPASVEVAPVSPAAKPLPSPPAASAPPAVSPAATAAKESPRSLVEIPTAVDLAYYSAREVDVLPRALRDIHPDYPTEADRRRLSGSVKLQIKLEADGRVSDIEVVESTPKGMFEESALAAFRQARFSPAQRNGRPVRARILIEVKYDYEGRLK
jgi:protein TonB